jgi:hypothetical protein
VATAPSAPGRTSTPRATASWPSTAWPADGLLDLHLPDNGRTLQRSPDQNGLEKFNQQSIVDRQWLEFTDDKTVFLNYNTVPRRDAGHPEVHRRRPHLRPSVRRGLGRQPARPAAAIKEGIVPGVPADKDVVYFPYNNGNLVKLAMSLDGGETFSQCLAVDAQVDPTAGFVAADHDSAGNIYVTYAEKGEEKDTYLVALRAADVSKCKGPNPVAQSEDNNVNPASPRRSASTARASRPRSCRGSPPAAPRPGGCRLLRHAQHRQPRRRRLQGDLARLREPDPRRLRRDPQIEQTQATSHPNHYDSICLAGLDCTINGADRSLVDYFTMNYDPVSGRLLVVYNQTAKKPGDAVGNIAAPVSLIQRAGPSNGGKTLTGPPVLRTRTADKPATRSAGGRQRTACSAARRRACPAATTCPRSTCSTSRSARGRPWRPVSRCRTAASP